MLTVFAVPLIVLQLASAVAGQACASTPDHPLPICAQYIRPFSENAYWWENSCDITPPTDTSILMAADTQTYHPGIPCNLTGGNPGHTMTCCAEIDHDCGVYGDCIGPETPPPAPYYPQFLAPGWVSFEVCALDNPARVFTDVTVMYLPGNTPYECTFQCTEVGDYAYAGVEYGDECYCGTGLVDENVRPTADVSECDVPCAGDYTESCGGSWRIQIYRFTLL
ncbi:WSC domain-containing protein [Phanerochaete sordida]|uniref:WSC domain-containing protein n=1 Tax=Phanerochaete sordida TaxID=48140 RepID=A0A9P3G8E6_9APHY|nr:WSC domain-containing protein [Phanerochaete sordida]